MANTQAIKPNRWFQQALNPSSLRFLTWYMLFISAAMLISASAFHWQGYNLPARLYWLAIPLHGLATGAIILISRAGKPPRTDGYLLMLLASMLLLGWFLHDSGGHTNPLISVLLLPVAMAAAILGWQASILMTLCAIAIYSALTEFYVPLNSNSAQLHGHAAHEHFMQLHLLGMWLTFGVSALLLLLVVQPLAASIRKQKEHIAQQREDTLRDEQLIALATFAASAAHQMGTPLSTLSILVDDLKEFSNAPEIEQDLNTMASQIDLCKTTLHDMMRKAEQVRSESTQAIQAETLLNQLQKQFTLLQPQLSLQVAHPIPDTHVIYSPTLEQALLNLLDNAAKASNDNPLIRVSENTDETIITIEDNGPGLPANLSDKVGQPFVKNDKNSGMGLGLFLSNATINRLGGTLQIRRNQRCENTVTLTEVRLPKTKGSPHGQHSIGG